MTDGCAAPAHPWQGDDQGHNCVGCHRDSVWRCDKAKHREHDSRCVSLTRDEPDGSCDCGIWAMIDAPPELREWVQDTYDDHGQFLWWRSFAFSDDEKRGQLRLIAAIDGMGG